MLVRDMTKKKEFKGIHWMISKEEWPNERIEMGPFTTKSTDQQREKVFINDDRINYIKNFGHLIYEHHLDPNEPVTILADCLGVGFDKSGRTYGIWGWYDGTETIDEKWEESQKYGSGMGYSIGGKRTEVQCTDGVCNLINPEILEISKTKSPANDGCTVYYINQFAKSIRETAIDNGDTFEIKSALKQMNKKFATRFEVDMDMDVGHALSFPCAKSYYYGMMETGLVQKSEARDLVEDELDTIKTKVVNKMDKETIEKLDNIVTRIEKMEMSPQGASPNAGGNQVLELLQGIMDTLTVIGGKLDTTGTPGGEMPPELDEEPTQDGENDPKDYDPPTEEAPPEDEEPEEDMDDEEKKRKVKKAEYHSETPEGENPETEDTMPPEEKEELDMPEGENPEPEGANPETVDEPIVDLGNADDDRDVVPDEADATDAVPETTEIPEETKAPENVAKGLVQKKEDTFIKGLTEKGYVVVKKDNKPVAHPSDNPGELVNTPEQTKQITKAKQGMFDMMYENGGKVTIPK